MSLLKNYVLDENGDLSMQQMGIIAICMVGLLCLIGFYITQITKVGKTSDKVSSKVSLPGVTYDGTLLD